MSRGNLIKQAMETCETCNMNNAGSAINNFGNSLKQDTNLNTKGKDGFTYDEGKGIKDNVILSGPLSEIYTRALNISLKKIPIDQVEETPDDLDKTLDTTVLKDKEVNTSDNIMVANEKMVMDEEIYAIIQDIKDLEIEDELLDKYKFTTVDTDPINVVANIAFMDPNQATQPENVDYLTNYKEDHDTQDTILVVTVPTHNQGHSGTQIKSKYIQLNDTSNGLFKTYVEEKFYDQSMESLYKSKGIKVYYGHEGLKEALRFINSRKYF